MTLDAIDCQAFAGGFTLGTVQAGFRLVGKREMKGGFGVASCEANRHLLGDKWVTEATDPQEWTPYAVPYVFGNPPCSGFSLLSRSDFRGIDSPVNSCMHAFVEFAARCRPDVAVFESVQPAFKQGRPLMQVLRDKMEAMTGDKYELFHMLHNASSVGGCAIRNRYFFLISKVPFGIEMPTPLRVPTLNQAIGDLEGLGDTWDAQPYRRPPSWWSRKLRNPAGVVDGHKNRLTPMWQRCMDLIEEVGWDTNESVSTVVRRYYEKYGRLPPSWDKQAEKLISKDFAMGFYQHHRWDGTKPARVVTGGAVQMVVHPNEDRLLTNREVARIQGFPDTWRIGPLRRHTSVDVIWGKGIPVQCGEWISGWAKQAIIGEPGTYTGELIGEREHVIDCSKSYKTAKLG